MIYIYVTWRFSDGVDFYCFFGDDDEARRGGGGDFRRRRAGDDAATAARRRGDADGILRRFGDKVDDLLRLSRCRGEE